MGIVAELHLQFERQREETVLRCLWQDPPWKIVRGFTLEHGENLVHLNNVSGGIFGGDSLKLTAQLHPGSQSQITTTGATRLYRPRPEAEDALLVSDFRIGRDATLEYLPDALIPFRLARAYQRTSYSLEEGATLFCWETLAPGRAASGERFAYDRLRLSTEIKVQGQPVLLDHLLLEPARSRMNTPALFAGCSYLVTFLVLRAGSTSTEVRNLEASLEALVYDPDFHGGQEAEGQRRTAHWGVTTLPAHGVMVRGVTDSALGIPSMLQALWSQAKQHLCGRCAVAPRKTY